jgi:hypothetical protein
VFVLGGIHVAIEERLEDSLCAELVDEAHHGMAFGVLAMVNGIVDFLSPVQLGTYFGPSQAQQWPLVIAPRFHGRHGAGGSASSECQFPFPKNMKFNFTESIPREFRSLLNTPTRTQGRLASTSRR